MVLRHLTTQSGHVYNLAQAKRDIASIYSTGLFEDVNFTPREAEDSTEAAPKVRQSGGRVGRSMAAAGLLAMDGGGRQRVGKGTQSSHPCWTAAYNLHLPFLALAACAWSTTRRLTLTSTSWSARQEGWAPVVAWRPAAAWASLEASPIQKRTCLG